MNLFSRLSELLAPTVGEIPSRVPALEAVLARLRAEMQEGPAAAERCAAALLAARRQLGQKVEPHRA